MVVIWMSHGKLTSTLGSSLRERLAEKSDMEVLYDHGKSTEPGVGALHLVMRDMPVSRASIVADADIAIVKGDRVLLLVEVEESSTESKTVIGDLAVPLLCDRMRFTGRDYSLDNAVVLVVLIAAQDSPAAQKARLVAERISILGQFGHGAGGVAECKVAVSENADLAPAPRTPRHL